MALFTKELATSMAAGGITVVNNPSWFGSDSTHYLYMILHEKSKSWDSQCCKLCEIQQEIACINTVLLISYLAHIFRM